MNRYINQYKILFLFSWIALYLIFPSWISLHVNFHARGLPIHNYPFARTMAILALTMYFSMSAFLMNRYFNALPVDKPFFIRISNWSENLKSNLWLVIFCCLSVILHIYSLTLVQLSFLTQGLWMYDFSSMYWNRLFDIPIQYLFWTLIISFILIIRQKKLINFISNFASAKFSKYRSSLSIKLLFMFIIFSFFSIYSYIFPYYPLDKSSDLLRYPQVSHFLYLITYYAFGVSHLGPRLVQLIFNVLGAVYLYRTILLFREKETALLGATIYLFSPLIFYYASSSSLASGTVFFLTLISYYFLSFLKGKDNRDLILATYFIGIGFLYRGEVLLMFIICFSYLMLSKIKKRDWTSIIHFKILLLSLIPILPWMLKIGSLSFSYEPHLVQMSLFERLTTYALLVHTQLSWIISGLLIVSIGFTLFAKKDDLSLFFGYSFIAYYSFFTLLLGSLRIHRYTLAFYPAICVLLALFLYSVSKRIRWKQSFKFIFSVLIIYLIIICLIPRSSSNLTTFRYTDIETQYYPIDKATDWIKNNVKNDDKILTLFMSDYRFYVERIYADKDKINQKRFIKNYGLRMIEELGNPLQDLKEFCHANEISYVMIAYPKNYLSPIYKVMTDMSKSFQENRGNDFMEAAEFNIDDNYITIYKMKGNPVK